MNPNRFFRTAAVLALLFVALFSCNVFAATKTFDYAPSLNADRADATLAGLQSDAGSWQSELYAMNTSDPMGSGAGYSKKASGFNLGTAHKYLGYGTVVAAISTAASGGDNGFHKGAAYVTAAAALSTVVTGILQHGDRFDLSEGFSRDNIHIALGTVGAAILTTAVAIADDGEEGSHSGLGVAGGVLMTLAVIDIKF